MATDNVLCGTPGAMAATPRSYPREQLWQVPLFFTGIAAVLTVWAARPYWYDSQPRKLARELAMAREILEDPHAPLEPVTSLLAEALTRVENCPDRAGETHFLLGSAYLRLAAQASADRSSDTWHTARTHLEEAERLGVPETDQVRLQYRLGKAWYHTGGEPKRVIDYVTQSLEDGADDRGEGYGMLAHCYLRLPVRDVHAAIKANERKLQLPARDENLLAPDRLLQGELLLEVQEREGARRVLARIGSWAPAAVLSRARYLRARSFQEDGNWAPAAKIWEEILADQREAPPDPGRLRYWLGLCYQNLRRPADAAHLWEQVTKYPGDDGQAATIRLAQLRLESGNAKGCLDLAVQALKDVTKPADYRNTLVDLALTQTLLKACCQAFRDTSNFDGAQQAARLHAKLAAAGPGQILLGEVAEAWAKVTRAQALQVAGSESASGEEAIARERFGEAAAAFEAAAEAASTTSEKAEWLWRASQAYGEAQQHAQVISVLGRFVRLGPSAERLSEAWFRLGEAHRILHHEKSAEESYWKCIEFAGPFAFRARYQLAVVQLEYGRILEAEETLVQNLGLMQRRESDPEAHEKTLYTLAGLYFLQFKYRLAAERWEQALSLYAKNPAAWPARYRLGESYRFQALQELPHSTAGSGLLGEPQPGNLRQYEQLLGKAAEQFKIVVQEFEARQKSGQQTEAEATLLRQARFAWGECLFDLRKYNEAIARYDDLAKEYRRQVEGVVALKHLWRCYVMTNQVDNASATLKGAKELLESLEDAAFQDRPEHETRAGFLRWIRESEDRLRSLKP